MNKVEFKKEVVLRFPVVSYDLKRESIISKLMSGPIQLASPTLAQSILSKDPKATLGLNKYINRSKYRSTPYGLFAGACVLDWGKEGFLKFNQNEIYTKTRLDAAVIDQIILKVIDLPSSLEFMSFNINQTIDKKANGYSYLEKSSEGTKIKYNLSKIEIDENIELIFESFKKKKELSYKELSTIFLNLEYDESVVNEYLKSLILSNILIPTIYPSSLLEQSFDSVYEFVQELLLRQNEKEYSRICKRILALKPLLEALDEKYNKISLYKKLESKLKKLNLDFRSNQMIQTDSFGDFTGSVDHMLKGNLARCISILNSRNYVNNDLENFKSNYFKKYQEGQAVSVMDVIYSDSGLGYAGTASKNNLFLEDIIPNKNQTNNKVELNDFQLDLNDLVKKGSFEIDVEDIFNKHNTNNQPPRLNGVYQSVMFHLLENEKLFVSDIQGYGADFISRFAYGHSKIEGIYQQIQERLPLENNEFIFAEIDFIPESRVQNISSRQNLFDYKIAICTSDIGKKKSLALTDLLVVVQYDKVLLYSKSKEKFVIPLFTNAYNIYRDQSLIFRFLENVGRQFFSQGSLFSWGDLTNLHNFLPRVTIAGCIVREAQWNFKKENFNELKSDLESESFKPKKYRLPEKVKYQRGDNFLIIDFNVSSERDLLFKEIKNKSEVTLKEYLKPKQDFVTDEHGNNYSHEILGFFKEIMPHEIVHEYHKPRSSGNLKREFLPGSEWLYYKFYCSPASSNEFLTKYIYPLAQEYAKLIDKWFFIRYEDQGSHLRIRFLVDSTSVGKLVGIINKVGHNAVNDGLIGNVAIDTYSREVERYGMDNIDINETLFHFNTCLIQPIIEMRSVNGISEKFIFLIGCRLFHITLEQADFSIEDRITITKGLFNSFFDEFKIEKELRLSIDKKYRKLSHEIESVILNEQELLDKKLVDQQFMLIRKMRNNIIDSKYFESIIISILHMTANRLFCDFQRYQEGLIYYFLFKKYKSLVAQLALSNES